MLRAWIRKLTPKAFANFSPGLELAVHYHDILYSLFFPEPVVSGLFHSPQALAWGPRCLLLLKTI